jgi:hypothetical protein
MSPLPAARVKGYGTAVTPNPGLTPPGYQMFYLLVRRAGALYCPNLLLSPLSPEGRPVRSRPQSGRARLLNFLLSPFSPEGRALPPDKISRTGDRVAGGAW